MDTYINLNNLKGNIIYHYSMKILVHGGIQQYCATYKDKYSSENTQSFHNCKDFDSIVHLELQYISFNAFFFYLI